MKTTQPILRGNTEFRKAIEQAKKSFRECLERRAKTVNINTRHRPPRHGKN